MHEGSGPIANQRTNASTSITLSNGERKNLDYGAFVKAIKKCYLPRGHPFGDYDETLQTAVFSQYGLGLVSTYALDWNVY